MNKAKMSKSLCEFDMQSVLLYLLGTVKLSLRNANNNFP